MRRFSSVWLPWRRSSTPAGSAARRRCSHCSSDGVGGNVQQHAVDAASAMQSALRGRDIHQDEAAAVAGIFQNAANRVVARLIVDLQPQLVAGFRAEDIADPDAVCRSALASASSASSCASVEVQPCGMIGDQVEADERNGLARRYRRRRSRRCAGGPGWGRQRRQRADDRVGHAADGGDLEVGSCRSSVSIEERNEPAAASPANSMASTTATPKRDSQHRQRKCAVGSR